MGFLNPLNLLLGLSVAALVAIYFRSRARPTIEVSSIALFDDAPAPVARSRRLRLDTLFWLEAAALTALTLGAAGLYVRVARPASKPVYQALLFDLGAAMSAPHENTTRLAEAIHSARGIIATAPPDQVFSIIGYALDAKLMQFETGRKEDLQRTLDQLAPTDVAPRAVALDAALVEAHGAGKIDLFTDHAPPPEMLADARRRAVVTVHMIGGVADNLALVALDPGVPKNSEGRCQLRNFADRPRTGELVIKAGDHEVFHSTLILEPRTQVTVRFGPLTQGGLVHAHLVTADGLAADNDRYALAPSLAPQRALVVSPDNAARDDLARILLAVNPAYRVTAIDASPAALHQIGTQQFDLAVLHDTSGAGISAAARLWVFPEPALAPSATPSLLDVTRSVAMAELQSRANAGQLATPVLLGPARVIALPGWMDSLAQGAGVGDPATFALAATGVWHGEAVGMVAFDVRNHLLLDPDRLEALLLMIDTVKKLAAPSAVQVVATGDLVNEAGFGTATLITPSGARQQLTADSWGRLRFRPDEAGHYILVANHRAVDVYANYYDETESDLAAASGVTAGLNRSQPALVQARLEYQAVPQTPLLIGIVLLALLMESALITRRSIRWEPRHV